MVLLIRDQENQLGGSQGCQGPAWRPPNIIHFFQKAQLAGYSSSETKRTSLEALKVARGQLGGPPTSFNFLRRPSLLGTPLETKKTSQEALKVARNHQLDGSPNICFRRPILLCTPHLRPRKPAWRLSRLPGASLETPQHHLLESESLTTRTRHVLLRRAVESLNDVKYNHNNYILIWISTQIATICYYFSWKRMSQNEVLDGFPSSLHAHELSHHCGHIIHKSFTKLQ